MKCEGFEPTRQNVSLRFSLCVACLDELGLLILSLGGGGGTGARKVKGNTRVDSFIKYTTLLGRFTQSHLLRFVWPPDAVRSAAMAKNCHNDYKMKFSVDEEFPDLSLHNNHMAKVPRPQTNTHPRSSAV